MNYLAHAFLGKATTGELVGQLMADEIKGSHFQHLIPEIQTGIWMHRWVDSTTDASPHLDEVKQLLRPHTGRLTGIALDVIMDHFLSIHWNAYASIGLTDFIQHVYQALEAHRDQWMPTSGFRLTKMIEQDWLGRYQSLEGIELTMKQMASRKSILAPLRYAPQLIDKHRVKLDDAFALLIRQLIVGYQGKINTFATLSSQRMYKDGQAK